MAKKEVVIECGDLVQDEVSGVKGIVTSVRVLLNGCVQFGVQPNDPEGKGLPDSWFIDWQTLKIVKKQAVKRTLPPAQFLFQTDAPVVEAGEKPSEGRGGPSFRLKAPRA